MVEGEATDEDWVSQSERAQLRLPEWWGCYVETQDPWQDNQPRRN
jgi:hypothetical protein